MDSAPLGIGGRLNRESVTAHRRTGWDDRPDSAVDDGESPVEPGKAAAPPSPSRLGTAAASACGSTPAATQAPAPAPTTPPAEPAPTAPPDGNGRLGNGHLG